MKKFQDLQEGQAAPAEAEIQVYANPGKTFVEIEEQGPYTTLEPGASVNWTVRWYAVPVEGTEGNLEKVKEILKGSQDHVHGSH